MRKLPVSIILTAALGSISLVSLSYADTTDVGWRTVVEVEKSGAHCRDDPNCFNRYHPSIAPGARAQPGDHIVFHTRDALDSDLSLDSISDDLAAIDLNLVHPMTGPVYVEGARRGDVLAVTLVDIEPDEYEHFLI